jgi:hypothetical protein
LRERRTNQKDVRLTNMKMKMGSKDSRISLKKEKSTKKERKR